MDEIDVMWIIFIHRPKPITERKFYCAIDGDRYSLMDSFQLSKDKAVLKVIFSTEDQKERAVVTFLGEEYELREVSIGGERLQVEQHCDVLPNVTEIFDKLDDEWKE